MNRNDPKRIPLTVKNHTKDGAKKTRIGFFDEKGETFKVPEQPGVYCVVESNGNNKTFYVGEASNLRTRLGFLFRCRPGKNPHPCHTAYKMVWGEFPETAKFCEQFKVEIMVTTGMRGRLEIEEELQRKAGSNKKKFYETWPK